MPTHAEMRARLDTLRKAVSLRLTSTIGHAGETGVIDLGQMVVALECEVLKLLDEAVDVGIETALHHPEVARLALGVREEQQLRFPAHSPGESNSRTPQGRS